MVSRVDSNKQRQLRHRRVRGKISGTAARPRLCVYRSLSNIYAQLIDDATGKTIVAAGSNEKGMESYGGNKEAAKNVGKLIAERSIAAGHENVVFDRGGYLFHGRVKELADAAREAGLKF